MWETERPLATCGERDCARRRVEWSGMTACTAVKERKAKSHKETRHGGTFNHGI
jgi:hypothetical protein